MARLYYDLVVPTSAAATSAQAGFPASNACTPFIEMPWRSKNTTAQDLTVSFPAGAVAGVILQDVNFATCTVKSTANGVAFDAGVAMATYANPLGRRRGAILLALAGKVGVRISIPAGATTDGLPYFRVGSVLVFMNSAKLATAPAKGYGVDMQMPQEASVLRNGQDSQANMGPMFDRLEFSFLQKYNQDFSFMLQALRRGICGLDMELTNFPDQIWPVRQTGNAVKREYPKANSYRFSLSLREIV